MLTRRYGYGFILRVSILAFSLVIIGCAKPPTMEIEKAEKAVAEAKQKEADLYAQDIFSKSEEALKKAKDFVGNNKYKEAKASAEESLGLAQQSITMIEPNKAKMKADAEQIVLDVQNSLNELKGTVVKATRKKAKINREEIEGAIGKFEIDMFSAKEQLQAGKIRQAYDQLVSGQQQVKSQKDSLDASLGITTAEKK
jgi:vacuolar-type H+-ATPase subunit H